MYIGLHLNLNLLIPQDFQNDSIFYHLISELINFSYHFYIVMLHIRLWTTAIDILSNNCSSHPSLGDWEAFFSPMYSW